MKKSCILLPLVAIIIVLLAGYYFVGNTYKTEYLRIHIRANSNAEEDQTVKYKVKDGIVEFLTPLLADCKTKEAAEKTINENLNRIEDIADAVLMENGYDYSSSAKIKSELFPTRVYEKITLESGYYDALIINLGEGAGDNWWCVVYPPLCFVGSGNYVYKSKIKEIIDGFYNKEKL